MSEFDLIANYFSWGKAQQNDSTIIKGVGDDAAVLSIPPNRQLVTSIDTLVSGVHFPCDTAPFDIAYKALAVNLSDLAAMSARPAWFTLALTLPFAASGVDHDWLNDFSRGLKTLANNTGIALIGGDTCRGPLVISIQVMGFVETDTALYRSGAKEGDKIYVTGTLGDAAAGLRSIQNSIVLSQVDKEYCQQRLNRPSARLDESRLIKDFASACIDVSDGLLQDLAHLLEQSKLEISKSTKSEKNIVNKQKIIGARLDISRIPFSQALKNIETQKALEFALTGGDDYELLFTIPAQIEAQFLQHCKAHNQHFTCIGIIGNNEGIVDTNNSPLNRKGFDHFL